MHILIIDDEPNSKIGPGIHTIFTQEEHDYIIVHSEKEALDYANSCLKNGTIIDVVISDLGYSYINGDMTTYEPFKGIHTLQQLDKLLPYGFIVIIESNSVNFEGKIVDELEMDSPNLALSKKSIVLEPFLHDLLQDNYRDFKNLLQQAKSSLEQIRLSEKAQADNTSYSLSCDDLLARIKALQSRAAWKRENGYD